MSVFTEWATKRGAALLYAPERYSEPLVNMAGTPLPAPTLMNGAGLIPGLVRGHAAVALAGDNDYIESGWKTRTNLHRAPSGDGVSLWGAPSTTVVSAPGGTGKISGLQPIRLTRQTSAGGSVTGWSPNIIVTPGATLTVSAYKHATSTPDGKLRIGIDWKKSGVVLSSAPTVLENAEGRAVVTSTAPAEANECTVIIDGIGTFGIGSTLDFEAVLAEESSSVSYYFPTAAQLASTDAVWTGTAFKSTSQLGVFVNGTTRSFFGVARRSTNGTGDVFFGSSGTGETNVVFRGATGSDNVLFSVNANVNRVEWANALPLQTPFTWALIFNETTNVVELFINGVSLGTKELPQTYSAAAGSLQVGATGSGSSNPWIGEQLPFAVFLGALSAEDVAIAHAALSFDAEVPPVVVTSAEPRSGRLGFYVRHPDGTEKRLAGDEPEAENIARNFTFGTAVPGGYTNTKLDTTRDPRIAYGDFDLYDEFIARSPGGESAFEGYNIEIPNSEDEQIGLVATGWASSLKDNPTLQEIYVDRDLGRWGPASSARKIYLLSINNPIGDASLLPDPNSGLPALDMSITDAWLSPWSPRVEAWYDAGPSARVAKLYFAWKATGAAPSNLSAFALSAEDQEINGNGANGSSGNVLSAEGSATYTPAAKRRYMAFDFRVAITPAGQDGASYGVMVRSIVVVGNHTVPITSDIGVLASDVVADVIRRAAPLLTYTTGSEGSISPSIYSIPHLIYPEPVTAEDAILQASKYDVPDWGVYNDRRFFWRPPTGGTLWVARQGDSGTTLEDTGKQAEDVYSGVVVQFTDPSGKTFLIGPPGTPGCDYTDPALKDYSETNPLNERGRVRLGKLVVGATTTIAGAVQLGSRWLQEELAATDRGTAVLTSFVQDSTGTYEPVWKVRAGDRIRFDDADGRERRIIETSYDHEARTVTLTLDSTPHRLEALMEKMQVELVAIGGGS